MRSLRILFVDDSFLFNLDVREFLQSLGIQVEPAYCASAAFEAIDRGRQLSALVTDVDLGPGPDGFDVARYARAAYPGLPVVYISGTRAASHAQEGVPGSEFIGKPLHPSQVAQALIRVTHLVAPPIAPPPVGRLRPPLAAGERSPTANQVG
jgi:CheY-like chemotaxis protein